MVDRNKESVRGRVVVYMYVHVCLNIIHICA